MSNSKGPQKYPWSHLDARVHTDRSPRQRMEDYLDLARKILHDPEIPNIGLASEAEGNLRIVSYKLSNSTSPTSPACTQATFGFTIPHSYVNVMGALQGAHAAHLIDRASFLLLAAAARPGFWDNSGMSRGMNMLFSKALLLGAEIEIDVEMETIDKSTCKTSSPPGQLTIHQKADCRHQVWLRDALESKGVAKFALLDSIA